MQKYNAYDVRSSKSASILSPFNPIYYNCIVLLNVNINLIFYIKASSYQFQHWCANH